MSIQIQSCGLVILLILLFFQSRQKRTHLVTEKIFGWVMGTGLVCLLLDIGSILLINYAAAPEHQVPQLVVDLVCKAYLLSIPAMGVAALLYICTDIYHDRPAALERAAFLWGLIALIAMVVIFTLPIEYHENAHGQITNTDGPSVYATYIAIVAYLALIIFHLIRDRSRLNRRRRRAVIVWMGLWIGSFIIQMMDNSRLLAGFATAAGLLVIYLALENPESNLDKKTGFFRQEVLFSYLRQLYNQKKDFSVLVLLFDHTQELRRGREETQRVRMELARYLEGCSWVTFRANGDKLYFLFDTPDQAWQAMEQIKTYITQHLNRKDTLPVKVNWLVMPNGRNADSQEELTRLVDEVARTHIFKEDFLEVDANTVREVRQNKEIEQMLHAAIAEDRVEVFYQPIYSIPKRRITGAEALVRIRDEDGSLIPPGLFIPIAESNGTILRLGKMIFEKVCRFIKDNPLDKLGLTYIDVNLSVVQCAYADLAMDYMDIMRRFGINPAHINLEITESASADEKNILLNNMDKLIDFGVSFALDDFGTGQSNLNYIMDMPVAVAKFDRQMTQAYFVSEKARQVMNAAVRMIHDMGLKIVSEGVETAEECKVIEDLGIEFIQGYYFSRPLPEQDFLDYLKNFRAPDPTPAAS